MGKRGPAPEPIPLRILKGRSPGRDVAGYTIPTPPSFDRGAPGCPETLTGEARKLWDRVAPMLEQLDLVTR
jgi:phage terminase small subunit